eukprot:s1260_g10.t1
MFTKSRSNGGTGQLKTGSAQEAKAACSRSCPRANGQPAKASVERCGAGLETVQVYATCKDCRKRRLPIMLVAFKKVKIEAGETTAVQLTVQLKDLAAYQGDGSNHFFTLEGGTYEFLVRSLRP